MQRYESNLYEPKQQYQSQLFKQRYALSDSKTINELMKA